MRFDGAPDLRKSHQSVFDPWARDPNQEDPLGRKPPVKHQLPEVLIASHEDPFLASGHFKQDFIRIAG